MTPSLPGVVGHVEYKTPPSGEWVLYDNPASSDRAQQVLPVSVKAFTGLVMVLDVCGLLFSFQSMPM